MFTIAFRNGQVPEGATAYNEEHLQDSYKNMHLEAKVGETFMDFISLTGNIADSGHPYIAFADDTDSISENPWFFQQLRQFLDLGIDNEAFFSMPCLMYFLELTGLQIPPIRHELVRKQGHEDDCLEDYIEVQENIDHFEHSMRAYLAAGTEVYDAPLTVYECESIDDACIASLHFLIVHNYNIRKCKNCGKYFVAYLRSDAEYCTRMSPYNQKKTCREDGPKRTFKASVNADVVKKTLKQIESARRMRKHRNPDNWDIAHEFKEWQIAMNRWRQNYQSGSISAEQFLEWLEDHKAYTEDWDYEENYI